MVTKYVVKKEFDFGICAIVLSVTGIQNIHEGATLKKWWMLILGIVAVLAAVVMALDFLGEVMLK